MSIQQVNSNLASADWLDTVEYPFASKFFATSVGRLHYIDEGRGNPVVCVHGNPTWSFLYRHVVRDLRATHRCIVPDLIGFGLSDKPDWTYRAVDQAAILEEFLESLDLYDMTLVVGDWGGPLGLAYAASHPQRVSHIVVTNTWCWPVNHSPYYQGFSAFMGGPVGRWLIQTRNFFANDILKMAFGDKTKLTEAIHRHYLLPLTPPEHRRGSAVFPREIIAATDWLQRLWDQREAYLGKVHAIVWGGKDIAFRKKELHRWTALCTAAQVIELPGCGHFVAEEAPDDLVRQIRAVEDHLLGTGDRTGADS